MVVCFVPPAIRVVPGIRNPRLPARHTHRLAVCHQHLRLAPLRELPFGVARPARFPGSSPSRPSFSQPFPRSGRRFHPLDRFLDCPVQPPGAGSRRGWMGQSADAARPLEPPCINRCLGVQRDTPGGMLRCKRESTPASLATHAFRSTPGNIPNHSPGMRPRSFLCFLLPCLSPRHGGSPEFP